MFCIIQGGILRQLRYLILTVLLSCVFSCEAPLNLSSVNEEAAKPTHRSDRFQSLATNNEAIVLVGSFGVILTSLDGGVSWTRQQLESQPTLVDIANCPDNSFVALALEGVVWISSDNGQSWTSKSLTSSETPQAIDCTTNNKIWVVGSFSTFASSSDRGSSWQDLSLEEDMILSYVKFFDAQNGIATAEFGRVLKTTDGGLNWEMQDSIPNEFYPIASLFVDMNKGWVAGLSGKILFTDDGGSHWIDQPTSFPVPIYGLSKGESQIYAVGALGAIFVKDLSDTQGSQWHLVDANEKTSSYIRTALITEKRQIFAGGSGALLSIAKPE